MSLPQTDWLLELPHAALSDVGMRRANNQDAFLVMLAPDLERWLERGHLFVVADGMGAHAAGELASRLAADTVGHSYLKQQESAPESLLRALRQANEVVYQRGQMNAEFHNMGTTCSSLLILPQGAIVAHVGDSRVYRLRGELLEQLTFDHSLQWEMRALARTREEENVSGIPKNVITRSLGPRSQVQIDLEGPFPLQSGDTFLLCSDGLSGVIADAELAGILRYLPPMEAASFLVDLANVRGGPDNITVIVAAIAGGELLRHAQQSPPLVIESCPSPSSAPHASLWIVLGAGLLLTLGFWTAGQPLLAVVSLATAVIAAGVALAQSARPTSAFPIDRGQRWGKGPYCQTDVPSPEELLASVCPSLGDSATQGVSGGASPQGEPSPTGENTPPITSRLRELAQIAHQLLYPPPNTVAP